MADNTIKAPAAPDRLLPGPNEVKMRLYGQGLGDCFLLAFARDGKPDNPCYVVIDCGVGMNTPDEKDRMNTIVRDINTATGGHIDVLAVTHEHYDHVIGFLHAKAEWQQIKVDAVWTAWTEKKDDPDAGSLEKVKVAFQKATVNALGQSLRMGVDAEAGFFGVDADLALDPAALAAGPGKITQAFDIAKGLCSPQLPTYCEPGDVRVLPGTDVRTYVLGPPRFKNGDGQPLLRKTTPLVKLLVDESEMYHYSDFGMTADGDSPAASSKDGKALAANAGFPPPHLSPDADPGMAGLSQAMMGAADTFSADEFNRCCPFDSTLCLEWDEALVQPFFWEHYTSGPTWRRVDGDWLGGASDLALRAGDIINNISLVLAFELPQTKKVLLFVGDAQVGNWLSWDFISTWNDIDGKKPLPEKPNIEELLGRVAFYKVGHHGSHNATIKAKGLERMAKQDGKDTDLLAFIPVSVPVAHDILGYCPMPFYPVLRALQKKTDGRVFLSNGELLQPTESSKTDAQLWQGVIKSNDRRPADILTPKVTKDGTVEGAVPLYLEVTM